RRVRTWRLSRAFGRRFRSSAWQTSSILRSSSKSRSPPGVIPAQPRLRIRRWLTRTKASVRENLAEEQLRTIIAGRTEELGGWAGLDDAAGVHEDHGIGNGSRKPHFVGHAHHGHARGREIDHDVEHFLDH